MKKIKVNNFEIEVLEHMAEAKWYLPSTAQRFYNRKQFFKAYLNVFKRNDYDYDLHKRVTEDIPEELIPEYADCSEVVPEGTKCYGMFCTTAPDTWVALFKLKDMEINKELIEDMNVRDCFFMENPDDGEIYFIDTDED